MPARSNVQSLWSSARAKLGGDRSKSTGAGENSIELTAGTLVGSVASNRKCPWMVEPADVCRVRPVTSAPSTLTGIEPNSPSVQLFDRPRYDWMMYWPGATFANSKCPSGRMRAPTEMFVTDEDR